MKCPKCGYNSFEYNDACPKCSNDLSGYKQTYGLKSIILPPQARVGMAETLKASLFAEEQVQEAADTSGDMFSFDLPEDELSAATEGPTFNDDPFNFDDTPAPAAPTAPAPQFGEFSFEGDKPASGSSSADDAFADLLEQAPAGGPSAAPVSAAPAGGSSGEFDLENFSWDDTPAPTTDNSAAAEEDNFDSLFGDAGDKKK